MPRLAFSELHSFAKKTNLSLKKAAALGNLQQLFHLPITAIAFEQLVQLANNIQALPHCNDHDVWSYIWGSHKFASSKVY